ncbi:MAG: hypothetical protein D084_Lepto4C00502G0002 [Leptospirillum sp. Group IV 'UBA BS']|nr:MAG: hypothetical protein D084_Lepto4C00502G0002 [Leptospirillum sp. Group IV 'UBA BS']
MIRLGNESFRTEPTIAPPIPPLLHLPKDEAIHTLTALDTKFIEGAIRAHP